MIEAAKLRSITVLTLFPEILSGFVNSSLIAKAREKKILDLELLNIRDFASPPHFQVDDAPYGGGPGMVMKAEPLALAIESAKAKLPDAKVILLSAGGTKFSQSKAKELSSHAELIFVCGRYEGVDQRVIDLLVDEEISIGDYVLMGGEVPAMVLIESTARLLDDVLGNRDSAKYESFAGEAPILEAAQYTRPHNFRGLEVPAVLMSGDHKKIAIWREEEAHRRTAKRRPDLLKSDK